MPPADPPLAGGPHAHAGLEVIVRKVLSGVAVLEPLAVDGPTAAKLVGDCCEKTLAGYPPERTGRFRLGRRVMYHAEKLKRFVTELAEEQAKN